eukprot:jgi/Mesvir1/29755/Mv25616-RA.1
MSTARRPKFASSGSTRGTRQGRGRSRTVASGFASTKPTDALRWLTNSSMASPSPSASQAFPPLPSTRHGRRQRRVSRTQRPPLPMAGRGTARKCQAPAALATRRSPPRTL